jgi:AcrR family transcriptional regulator
MTYNEGTGWRDAKRRAAHESIVDAAWRLVRADGLAGLSLRELAKEAGITTPTVYAYFDSKFSIYDSMFRRAATEFTEWMTQPSAAANPDAALAEGMHRFVAFCTSDVARYQLLFQRTIPGFEPSAEAYEPAQQALAAARQRLADAGIDDPRHLDIWTALNTGLVDQQVSNDPGGQRWSDLVDDVVTMFLSHCRRKPGRGSR